MPLVRAAIIQLLEQRLVALVVLILIQAQALLLAQDAVSEIMLQPHLLLALLVLILLQTLLHLLIQEPAAVPTIVRWVRSLVMVVINQTLLLKLVRNVRRERFQTDHQLVRVVLRVIILGPELQVVALAGLILIQVQVQALVPVVEWELMLRPLQDLVLLVLMPFQMQHH